MNTTAVLVFALMTGSSPADAGNNQPARGPDERARELVKQLADAKFKVRDAAEKELLEMGLASLNALKEGEKHPDIHVQDRCRALQPTIRAFVLKKRIDSFLAAADQPMPTDLPFAKSFVKIVGDSKEARALYAEVLQTSGDMLDEVERNKKKGGEIFTAYCQDIAQRMQYGEGATVRTRQKSISRANVAIYFLLARELPTDTTGRVLNFGYSFLRTPVVAETLGKKTPEAEPFKKLFLNWLEKEPQPFFAEQGLQVAVNAKMQEALPLILRHIKSKDIPAYTKAQTALLLPRIATKDQIKDVEPLLEDKTVVGSFNINNVNGSVQMRDVALAVCIKLSGQKLADYDFDVMKGSDELASMSYVYCAFTGDGKRNAAHQKYKDSREKELKK